VQMIKKPAIQAKAVTKPSKMVSNVFIFIILPGRDTIAALTPPMAGLVQLNRGRYLYACLIMGLPVGIYCHGKVPFGTAAFEVAFLNLGP
jgi:hypothetical protein